jgi:hypothetical protein
MRNSKFDAEEQPQTTEFHLLFPDGVTALFNNFYDQKDYKTR